MTSSSGSYGVGGSEIAIPDIPGRGYEVRTDLIEKLTVRKRRFAPWRWWRRRLGFKPAARRASGPKLPRSRTLLGGHVLLREPFPLPASYGFLAGTPPAITLKIEC